MRGRKHPPPVERLLAGELGSPLEVLGNDKLTIHQKREILEVWRGDLIRRDEHTQYPSMFAEIEEAIAAVDKDRKR